MTTSILHRYDHIPAKPYYNQNGLFHMPLPKFWPNDGGGGGWHANSTWKLQAVQFSDRLQGCGKAYHFIQRHAEYGKGKTVKRFGYYGPFYAAFQIDGNNERVSCTYLWGLQDYCLGQSPKWCGPYDVYRYCLHDIPNNFITPKLELDPYTYR